MRGELIKMEINKIIERVKCTFEDAFEHREEPPKPPEYRILRLEPLEVDFSSNMPVNAEKIGEEKSEETMEAIRKHGTEAIAFYAPFHFYYPSYWGVYIIEDRLYGFAYLVYQKIRTKGILFDDIVELCRKCILEHEYFHFRTEFFSLVWEDFAEKIVYKRFKRENQPYCEMEEALANAYEVRKSILISRKQHIHGFSHAIRDLCRDAPAGYNNFENCLRGHQIKNECIYEFVTHILKVVDDVRLVTNRISLVSKGLSYASWFPTHSFMRENILRQIPEYVCQPPSIPSDKRLYMILANKRIDDLLTCLERKYGCKIRDNHGKHPKIELPNGKKISYSYSSSRRKGIYPRLIKEIASSLGIEKKEILKECFGIN